jgi:hypothetical protein
MYNPTIVRFYTGAVIIYNATSSPMSFFYFENTLAYHNAGVVVVNS